MFLPAVTWERREERMTNKTRKEGKRRGRKSGAMVRALEQPENQKCYCEVRVAGGGGFIVVEGKEDVPDKIRTGGGQGMGLRGWQTCSHRLYHCCISAAGLSLCGIIVFLIRRQTCFQQTGFLGTRIARSDLTDSSLLGAARKSFAR